MIRFACLYLQMDQQDKVIEKLEQEKQELSVRLSGSHTVHV